MTAPLCTAPRCRARGLHAPDCPGDCAGCLPRRAADGLALCLPHTQWIGPDARQAAQLYDDLALVLDAGSGIPGERMSGSPDRTRMPNPAAVEERTRIRHTLASWCRLISEERGIGLPRDTVAAMADYIARHDQWLAAHPAAGECSDELRELAHGRPWRVAYPDGTRTVRVDDCPHSGCDGEIRAVLRRVDSLLPSRIVCSEDGGHEWPASQWITLGRQLRRVA